jgi:predicted branched-subunit amino acid permease
MLIENRWEWCICFTITDEAWGAGSASWDVHVAKKTSRTRLALIWSTWNIIIYNVIAWPT